MTVEGRNINSGNPGYFFQKPFLAPSFRLCTVVECHDLGGTFLALSQGEEVNKVRQRLRIEGAHASGKNHVVKSLTFAGMERNPRQEQHIQDVGIGHFIADGEGDHVKILHGVLAFQCPQREGMGPHGLLHVPPGSKHPLAPDAVHPVHHTVQNPHPHIGHTNLISIREAERHPDPNIFFFLLHLAPLAASVPGRLLNCGKDSPLQVGHIATSYFRVTILYPFFPLFARYFSFRAGRKGIISAGSRKDAAINTTPAAIPMERPF